MIKNMIASLIILVGFSTYLVAEPITLKFLGPDDKPISGATALAWANPKPKNWQNRRFEVKADENGVAVIPFEPNENMSAFTINVKTSGFMPFCANFHRLRNNTASFPFQR